MSNFQLLETMNWLFLFLSFNNKKHFPSKKKKKQYETYTCNYNCLFSIYFVTIMD